MSKSTIRPRPDQLAELTRGQELPLDPIADVHLGIILENVFKVWHKLLGERPEALMGGNEAEINALMESSLNNLWSDPLWSQLVTSVSRGKESLSYDGAHLEKRPDLSIYLTGKHPSFPVVVECKIIDKASGKGVDLYCKNGISRFVKGEYAWANREGIMIAYIRDDASIKNHLLPLLATGRRLLPDPWETTQLPMAKTAVHRHVLSSHHHRSFSYSKRTSSGAPGTIALWHVWLYADTVGESSPGTGCSTKSSADPEV